MADKDFDTNLLRFIAAGQFSLLCVQTSHAMFSKGYFSLSPAEKLAVDQAASGFLMANYNSITPQLLNPQASQEPIGFQAPGGEQSQENLKSKS
jgi:hypothetical protein